MAKLDSDTDMTMYRSEFEGDIWQPGETLPQQGGSDQPNCFSGNSEHTIRDLFQMMESKIDTAFSDFNQKLQDFDARITAIEQRPPISPGSTSTPGSSSSSDDGKRKRRTPLELQVCVECL